MEMENKYLIIKKEMDASITLVVMQPMILPHENKDKDMQSCWWGQQLSSM